MGSSEAEGVDCKGGAKARIPESVLWGSTWGTEGLCHAQDHQKHDIQRNICAVP